MRTRVLILLAGLATIPVALAHAQATPTTPTTAATSPQKLFSKLLLADSRVTKPIKTLLTSKVAYIDPAPVFADITGDGKSDAIVSVDGGGASGAIAVYVLSGDGSTSGALKVVYRNQALYRATTTASGDTITISNPHWAAGDDLWDPKKIVKRTYEWKSSSHTLVRTGTTVVDGPTTVTTVVGGTTTTPAAPAG